VGTVEDQFEKMRKRAYEGADPKIIAAGEAAAVEDLKRLEEINTEFEAEVKRAVDNYIKKTNNLKIDTFICLGRLHKSLQGFVSGVSHTTTMRAALAVFEMQCMVQDLKGKQRGH